MSFFEACVYDLLIEYPVTNTQTALTVINSALPEPVYS